MEPHPLTEEPAAESLLFTTVPVDCETQLAAVVDNYRARLTIEEFNKAINTGSACESREFETLHALLMTLAISLPIACELRWLRSRARADAPATDVLTSQQLKILRQLGVRALPAVPTARDVLWAVAGLRGHQKRNGESGWLVLYRGMQTLLTTRLAMLAYRLTRG